MNEKKEQKLSFVIPCYRSEQTIEQQIKDIISVFSPENNRSKIIYCPDKTIPDIKYHYDISNAVEDLGYKPKYFHVQMLEDIKNEMHIKRFSFLGKR